MSCKSIRLHAAAAFLITICIDAATNAARAATIERTLVVEPDFKTTFHFDPFSSGYHTDTITHMNVPVPPLTLAPRDVLRVGIEFSNGQYLRRFPTPPEAAQQFYALLAVGNPVAFPYTVYHGVEGEQRVQVFDHLGQLVQEQTDFLFFSVNRNSDEILGTGAIVRNNGVPDVPLTGPTIGKIVFELTMPSTLDSFYGPIPYRSTTFMMNDIQLSSSIFEFADVPTYAAALLVVPEPSGFVPAACLWIAAWNCRRTRRFLSTSGVVQQNGPGRKTRSPAA